MMPRPTKLTPDTQSAIVQALQAGNYFDASCEYAGITATTGYNWKKRGKEEAERRQKPNIKEGSKTWETEQPFFEFFEAVKKAEANAEVAMAAIIRKASNESWQAAAWWLERRFPDKWGRRQTDVKHDGEVTIKVVRE